jgi:hypothetical protein
LPADLDPDSKTGYESKKAKKANDKEEEKSFF